MDLKDRIRQLEAEADMLARENETLSRKLESTCGHVEKLTKELIELKNLANDLYKALQWENPDATQTFEERIEKWRKA